MGRKAVDKERKYNPAKIDLWAKQLFPYFMAKGTQSVNMDDLAAYLGKSKATLYKYFRSKKEMITATLQRYIQEMMQFENILKDDNLPFKERYLESMTHVLTVIAGISTNFLLELKEEFPDVWELINQFQEHLYIQMDRFYSEAQAAGAFREFDTRIMFLSDKFFVDGITNPDVLKDYNLSLDEACAEYLKMKLKAIAVD